MIGPIYFNQVPIIVTMAGSTQSAGPVVPQASEWKEVSKETWEEWKEKFILTPIDSKTGEPGDKSFVRDPSQKDQIVSEGMGWGLLKAVQFNDQETFDNLLRGLKEMEGYGLPSWKGYIEDGKFVAKRYGDRDSAIDADQDIAMALMQAQELVERDSWFVDGWHEPIEGENYYKERAQHYLDLIWNNGVKKFGNIYVLMPSEDWGSVSGGVEVNLSYIAPAWYDYFASFDNNPNHNWRKLKDDSYRLVNAAVDKFGHIPDWCIVIVNPEKEFVVYTHETRSTKQGMDAIRTLWRFATDALWAQEGSKDKKRAILMCRKLISPSGKPQDIVVSNLSTYDPKGGGPYKKAMVQAMYITAARAAVMKLPEENPPREYVDLYRRLSVQFRGFYDKSGKFFRYGRFDTGESSEYYTQSLCLFAAMYLGENFVPIAPRERPPVDTPVITEIRSRHHGWPWYHGEYAYHDTLRDERGELNLLQMITWQEGADPTLVVTNKEGLKLAEKFVEWSYYDEAINQYKVILTHMRYEDEREIVLKATEGLVGAATKGSKTHRGIEVLEEVLKFDRGNYAAMAALANLLSFEPDKTSQERARALCRTAIYLIEIDQIKDEQTVINALQVLASLKARKSKDAAAKTQFEIAVNELASLKMICDFSHTGVLPEEGTERSAILNEIVGFHKTDLKFVQKLLRRLKYNHERKIRARLVEADLLLGVTNEMLMHLEIQRISTNEHRIISNEMQGTNYKTQKFIEVKIKGKKITDILRKEYNDYAQGLYIDVAKSDLDDFDAKYKALRGLMTTYSTSGLLQAKTEGMAEESKKDFDISLALNDFMLAYLERDVRGTSHIKLPENLRELAPSNMKGIRKHLLKDPLAEREILSANVDIRCERMQIFNHMRNFKESIDIYKGLISELDIGRVRPHFERILYYIDIGEYEAAKTDCNALFAAAESIKGMEQEILSAEDKANIEKARKALLDIMRDKNWAQIGRPDEKLKAAALDALLDISSAEVSKRNRKIFYEALDDAEAGNFSDAYSKLTLCLEIDHMFEANLMRMKRNRASLEMIRKEFEVMKKTEEIKNLLENKEFGEARVLSKELIDICEKDLKEDEPNAHVQRAVLLEATPKYVLALAESGRPLEAIVIYKSLLDMDYSCIEFVDDKKRKYKIEEGHFELKDDTKGVLLTLEDKELEGYKDIMFRGESYIRDDVLEGLANIYMWRVTQEAYMKVISDNNPRMGKSGLKVAARNEALGLSLKYYEEVYRLDASNIAVLFRILELCTWLKDKRYDEYRQLFEISIGGEE